MIDHFKKLKNPTDRSKKIEKSINRSQKIDQAIDQTINEKKMENHTLFFYLLSVKIKKKIDHSINSKLSDRTSMIEIPRSRKNRLVCETLVWPLGTGSKT